MTKKEKQALIKKIIKFTDENIEEEQFVYHLLQDDSFYTIQENDKPRFSQVAADKIAKFAGSWGFILSFTALLIFWIILNIYLAMNLHAFDPYPFVLLNLVLSCIAALQAPLVMMSQNRQEEKDRQRAQEEFKINLKSEIIIEDIYHKIENIQKTLNNLKDEK